MAQRGESEVLHLVGLMYDAAMAGHDFTTTMERIAATIGAKSALLRMVDYSNHQISFFDTFGYDLAWQCAYADYYIQLDIYRDFFETAPVGTFLCARELPDYEARCNTEYHNDYTLPQGIEHVAGGVLARDHSSIVNFGIQRGKDTRHFDQNEIVLLKLLLPHLASAVKMRQLLAASATQRRVTESALDLLRAGVVLTDARARPLFINRMAEELIAGCGGAVTLSQNGVTLRRAEATANLHRRVAVAAATSAGAGLATGGGVRAESLDGSCLQLYVTPLSRQRLAGFTAPTACAAIFISRPGTIHLPWRAVALCYALTQAEAKLAVRLASGESLDEAAETLSISIHTARTQLKSVFAKTGTRRQPELVAMLLQGVLAQCQNEESDT